MVLGNWIIYRGKPSWLCLISLFELCLAQKHAVITQDQLFAREKNYWQCTYQMVLCTAYCFLSNSCNTGLESIILLVLRVSLIIDATNFSLFNKQFSDIFNNLYNTRTTTRIVNISNNFSLLFSSSSSSSSSFTQQVYWSWNIVIRGVLPLFTQELKLLLLMNNAQTIIEEKAKFEEPHIYFNSAQRRIFCRKCIRHAWRLCKLLYPLSNGTRLAFSIMADPL